ncbi:MAG: PAS domain S-box protein [Burkholderiales bacterium]
MSDDTDHGRDVAQLRERAITLQQILDNSTTVRLFAKDRAGRYLFVNRAFEQHVGRPAAEIVGLTPGDIAPAEIAAGLRANDRRVIETGEPLEIEESNVIRGERRTLLANKFPLLGADGRPYAVCGISVDITERKRTEEALRRAALAVSTAAGPALFETLVRQLAEILGVGVAAITVFFDERRTHMRTVAACLDGRMLAPFEYLVATSPCAGMIGREFRYVREGVRPEFAPQSIFAQFEFDSYAAYSLSASSGEQLGLIVVMDRKPLGERALTEALLKIFAVRAAAELERARADEALRASEASYREIFEANEDAIFVHDWDTGRILDVSPKTAELFGHSRAALRELRVGALSADVPPYTEQDAVGWLERAKAAAEPVRFEWRGRRSDGRLMWNEVTLKRATIAGVRRILAFVRDVTDAKRAEEAVRASEAQYRAIFNASADALVLWNSALKRVDVNPAYERMYGLTRAEVLDPSYPDHRPREFVEQRREIVRRTLAGEPCQVELEAVRKNGERIQIEVRTIPVQHRGEPHVLAIVRDITARRRADDALRASEEQYRAIFNASVDGLLLWDAGHRIVDANEAFLAMHGYAREEIVGQSEPLFVPAALQSQCVELLPKILTGSPCRLEARTRRKDGTEFDVEIHGVPMQYQGRPHALIILRDVTEAKRAEERLRASEQRYRLLFEMESDAILVVDADSLRLLDANRAAESLWGYARAELMTMTAADLSAEPAETRGSIQSPEGRVHIPLRHHRRRDGTVFPVEITSNRLQLDGRKIVIATIRDITERERAEAARRALEAQLRQAQKMEAIGQLTGGIAHDFNNILTSIVGYVTLAAEREAAAADAKVAGYLEQAARSCRRARDLIQQMLTFSRGQRGERRPVDLRRLVADSARLLHSSMPSTLDLEVAGGAQVPLVSLDRVQAEQVLLNLCINARDALAGQGKVRIGVRRARHAAVCASCRSAFDGEFVELAVSDDGPGIAPGLMERIFDPFFSTKEVGKGSGMGLAMVHGIVHDHGGHVVVETQPDAGTTFRVLFPALAPDGVEAEHETLTGLAPAARRPRLRGRVLVAEDEEMVRAFMRELLEGWGLEVDAAGDGAEAYALFAGAPERHDLVITDQTMPRLTGVALARELAARRPGLPVILYSGYADAITEAEVQAAGIRALVRKPVEPAALRGLVESLLPGAARAA